MQHACLREAHEDVTATSSHHASVAISVTDWLPAHFCNKTLSVGKLLDSFRHLIASLEAVRHVLVEQASPFDPWKGLSGTVCLAGGPQFVHFLRCLFVDVVGIVEVLQRELAWSCICIVVKRVFELLVASVIFLLCFSCLA